MTDIKELLKNMTIREKIGQLSQYNASVFIDIFSFYWENHVPFLHFPS